MVAGWPRPSGPPGAGAVGGGADRALAKETLANLAVRAGSGCPREGFKKARK